MFKIVAAVAVVAVIVAGAWFFFFRDANPAELGGLPATVAVVNSEDISREDYEVVERNVAAGQGIDMAILDEETRMALRRQILDSVITQRLVHQAAEASGAAADPAAVETEFAAIRAQFESDEAFAAALEAEALTEDGLREQITDNLVTQAYLESELQLSTFTATDEEIQAMYEEVAAGGAEVPPLEEVREQVEALVLQQKQQEVVATLVERLRTEANIEILI